MGLYVHEVQLCPSRTELLRVYHLHSHPLKGIHLKKNNIQTISDNLANAEITGARVEDKKKKDKESHCIHQK